MLSKVPVTIISGFLGAGKTTLIRHVIEHAHGMRLALVINEFGEAGVDGEILKSCGADACPAENIVELANGCLCCTVAGDFIPTVETLLARSPRPDHIIIETSGLALPKPLIKAFDWPSIRAHLTVDGVVTVVDGAAVADGRFADDPEKVVRMRAEDPSIDHENPLEEVYEDQLSCADLIILNKVNLMTPEDVRRVTQEIESRIPRSVKIIASHDGRVSKDILLGLGAAAEDDLDARPSHHDAEEGHDHDDFESFVLTLPAVTDADALIDRLGMLAEKHDILRIKGYVDVAGKPMRLLVQGVGSRFNKQYDRTWNDDETRVSRLMIIGEKGMDQQAISAALIGKG